MSGRKPKFWVFYDGECVFCRGWAGRFRGVLARRNIGLAPLQEPWVMQRLGITAGASLTEMKVWTDGGAVIGGIDGVLYVFRAVWWLWPLNGLGRVPGLHGMIDRGYRWLAARRHCFGGRCRVDAGATGASGSDVRHGRTL